MMITMMPAMTTNADATHAHTASRRFGVDS
jgi:hypothetical protein